MKRVEDWTYNDAVAAVDAHVNERVGDDYATNAAMIEDGDFWQDGKHWVGPRGGDVAWEAAIKAAVERQHIPGGAILEGVGNFVRGLVGKQANIQAVPLEGDADDEAAREAAAELVEALSVWWDDRRLWEKMRRVVARSRWAGWGTFRLRILPAKLERTRTEDGEVTRLPRMESFADALAAIDLEAPEPDQCVVIEHPDTGQRVAIFHYAVIDDGNKGKNRVEVWYEDGDKTRLRVLEEGGEQVASGEYDWGGRLPVSEMDGELMVTEPVRRAEAAFAFAQTMVVRAGESAGFRERTTSNAEPAGLWLPTPPVNGPVRSIDDGRGGTLYFHPLPRSLGAGVTTDLVGIVTKATDAGEERATPSITYADPVDPEFAIRPAHHWRARVLELCQQGHLALITRGESSGIGYEQARATFAADLDAHVDPAERALTEILEAAVTMAESMQANPDRWLERFRMIVTITPDPGPISPERRKQIIEEVKAGLKARSTAMAELGTDDVAAELDAIEQDPQSQLGAIKERVGIMLQLKAAEPDLSLVQAAIAVGWDADEARDLFGEADAAAAQARQAREEIADALRGGREGEPEPRVAA